MNTHNQHTPPPYPFIRNRYYYGKMLTVRDFELEQAYTRGKIRLLNRLLFGSGIVSGLKVTVTDEEQLAVTVEPGLAIDQGGREIIVPSIQTRQLSTLEGFKINNFNKSVYLCLAYDEKELEPLNALVHSSKSMNEVMENNRTQETFKLLLRDRPPADEDLPYPGLFEQSCVLYEDKEVRVWFQTPVFVEQGSEFTLVLHVDKSPDSGAVQLQFETQSSRFVQQEEGEDTVSVIRFTEPSMSGRTSYVEQWTYRMMTSSPPEDTETFGIRPGSLRLTVGGKNKAVDTSLIPDLTIQITREPAGERILREYTQRPLHQALRQPEQDLIYLAKIHLIQLSDPSRSVNTYYIDSYESVPFQPCIHNPMLLHRLQRQGNGGPHSAKEAAVPRQPPRPPGRELRIEPILETVAAGQPPGLSAAYDQAAQTIHLKLQLPETEKPSGEYTTGYIDLPVKPSGLNPFARSEVIMREVVHGLGPGQVYVQVGVETGMGEDPDAASPSSSIYYGSSEVFKDTLYECDAPRLSIGTIVYPRLGTFRLGVKLLQAAEDDTIRLRWWAFRRNEYTQPFTLHAREAAAGSDTGSGTGTDSGEEPG
ncbi:hypothetical protein J2T17_002617 [Paenibacillus mucilaginosus]|uniref:hypothetical protein n=1 Tax=Paenibacillus mucilaginosus TaxID=61624 RepID=UPI003D23F331